LPSSFSLEWTVRSSTSSFERGVPRGQWGKTWLAVMFVVVLCVVRFEMFLRSRGYQPSIKDDEYAWSWERGRLSDGSHHVVALVGSSRIMIDFSGEAFRQTLPDWRYVQLGINGTTGIGTLIDLSNDPNFRGVAIVDVSELAFYRDAWVSQDSYIATYHRGLRGIGAIAERRLETAVQSHLALLATRGVELLGKLWRSREWPKPPYIVTHADRTRSADFSLAELEHQRLARLATIEGWEKTSRDPAAWLADALALEPAIAAIKARGGNVAYVRMPTCGERWEADERITPKAQFWDQLASKTHAVAIHFKDYPELANVRCPDASHIDSKDAPRFTRSLLEILQTRGTFKEPPG
jgi:hypothetical protein